MASPWARPAFKGKGRDSSPFTPRQSLNYSSFLGDSAKRFVGMYKAQPTHFLSIALASFFLAKKRNSDKTNKQQKQLCIISNSMPYWSATRDVFQ